MEEILLVSLVETINHNQDYQDMVLFVKIMGIVIVPICIVCWKMKRDEKKRRNEFKFDDPGDFYHGDIYKR